MEINKVTENDPTVAKNIMYVRTIIY